MWIDAHNHLHDTRLGVCNDSQIDVLRQAGVEMVVVNGTCPEDWPQVASLAARYPSFVVPSFGLHPWKAGAARTGWMDTLAGFLRDHPHAGVGEIGLDRRIREADMATQIHAFRAQWEWAAANDRAISVHCLKAWEELFSLWPDLPAHAGRVLLHGFTGSLPLARALVARGFHLGFGGRVLHDAKSAAQSAFADIPLHHILLETDAPDMPAPESLRNYFLSDHKLNHPANLAAHGGFLARLRHLPQDALAQALRDNTRIWLGGPAGTSSADPKFPAR